MESSVVLALARHLLTFIGAVVVTFGWLDSATVQTLVGAGLTLVSTLWSFWDKKNVQALVGK